MSDELFKELREMRTEATERHVDTVQRLTVIETKVTDHKADIDSHDEAIGGLTTWRNVVVGGGLVVMAIVAWLFYVALPLLAQAKH